MGRYSAGTLILLGLFAVVARPDDTTQPKKGESGKAEQLTEEKLNGVWEGKLENGSVKVKFDAKGDRKIAVAVVVLKVGRSVAVGSVGYEIDATKNEVKFPSAKDATAKPTKEGALLLSGQFTFGGKLYTVPETRIERVKAEPKKEPKEGQGGKTATRLDGLAGKWTMPKLALLSFKDGTGYDLWSLTKLDIVLDDKGKGEMSFRKEQLGTKPKKIEAGSIKIQIKERDGKLMIDSFQGSSWQVAIVEKQLSITPTQPELLGKYRTALFLDRKQE